MNARPIYDSDEFTEVLYKGRTYPFKFTTKVLKLFRERYEDGWSQDIGEITWQLATLFDAAVKIADYFGLEPLPKVTAEELEETLDVAELRQLHGAVATAIQKMNSKINGQNEGEEWDTAEMDKLGDLPRPDEDEKNR